MNLWFCPIPPSLFFHELVVLSNSTIPFFHELVVLSNSTIPFFPELVVLSNSTIPFFHELVVLSNLHPLKRITVLQKKLGLWRYFLVLVFQN